MFELFQSRWLPTIALVVAIPASAQSAFSSGSTEGTSAPSGNSIGGDRPIVLPQVSDEEMGMLMMYRQRYQAAIEAFDKIASPSAVVWNQKGIAYQMMFDYRDAIRCYKKALGLNPNDSIVLGNLATAQDGMKDFGAAERNYRKSLKLDPNSALTLKNLGTNLLMQHKHEAGNAAYKQALLLDPRIFEDHIGLKMNVPAPDIERGTAAYFKAKSCAVAGLNDCAISYLRKAMNEGMTLKQINEEQDFASLRNTPAYTNLVVLER